MSHSNCLKDVVNLIGHQAAIRLVREKGGKELKLPNTNHLSDNNWLVLLVGMSNATKLCDYFVDRHLKLPIEVNALLQLRNASIAIDYQDGLSIVELSKRYQVDRKLIQKILDTFDYRNTHQLNLNLR